MEAASNVEGVQEFQASPTSTVAIPSAYSLAAPPARAVRRRARKPGGPHPTHADYATLHTAYLHNWSYMRMSKEAPLQSKRTYEQIKQHFMFLKRKQQVGPSSVDKKGRRWMTLELMQRYGVEGELEERDGKVWAVEG